jgi:hypothetical protein
MKILGGKNQQKEPNLFKAALQPPGETQASFSELRHSPQGQQCCPEVVDVIRQPIRPVEELWHFLGKPQNVLTTEDSCIVRWAKEPGRRGVHLPCNHSPCGT